jgi:hypothetical protein
MAASKKGQHKQVTRRVKERRGKGDIKKTPAKERGVICFFFCTKVICK